MVSGTALPPPRSSPLRRGTESGRSGASPRRSRVTDPPPPLARLDEMRIDWATFWAKDRTDAEWLVEPVIAAGRNHALVAPGKTGKSLMVLAAVTPATLGEASLDRPAGDPLRVLYLDYEMTEADVQERLVDMGHGPEFTPESFAYLLHPSIPPLDTPLGGNEVAHLADEHGAELVVIDTYSRAVEGGENDNDTTRNLYRCTLAPLKARGIATLRLDHTGHADTTRARGNSAKGDDIDLGWLLARAEGGFKLTATHARSPWMPRTVNVRLDGTPLRASVVAGSWPAGTAAGADRLDALGVPLDASQRAAREALKDAGETMNNEVLRAALKYRRSDLRGLG